MLSQIKIRLVALPVVLLSSTSLIGTVINMSIGIFLARIFDPNIYGQMLYFIAIMSNVRIISSMGMNTKTIKDVADNSDHDETLNQVFYSMISVRLSVGGVLAIIISILGISSQTPFIAGAAFLAIVLTVMDSFQVYFQGLRATRIVSILLLTQPLIYLMLSLVWGYRSLDTALWSLSISYVITVVLTLFIAYIIDHHLHAPRLRYFSFQYLRGAAHEIFILFGMGILQQLCMTMPILILSIHKDFAASAAISIILSFVVQYDAVTDITGWAWLLPSIRRIMALGGDKHQIRVMFDDFTRLLMLGAIWLCAIMIVWPDHILAVLYGDKYLSQATLLSLAALLTPCLVYFGTQAVCLIGINQTGKALTGRIIQFALTLPAIFLFSFVLTGLSIETKLNGIIFSFVIATIIAMSQQEYLIIKELNGRPPLLYYITMLIGSVLICVLFRQLGVVLPITLEGVPGLVLLPLVSGLTAAGMVFAFNSMWKRKRTKSTA